MCDRCQEKVKLWMMPVKYKDMNDKSHRDLGDGYRQYFVCDGCREHENALLVHQFGMDMSWWKLEDDKIAAYTQDFNRWLQTNANKKSEVDYDDNTEDSSEDIVMISVVD